jgi:hypothetical protein
MAALWRDLFRVCLSVSLSLSVSVSLSRCCSLTSLDLSVSFSRLSLSLSLSLSHSLCLSLFRLSLSRLSLVSLLTSQVIFNMPIHYLFSPASVDKLQIHYSNLKKASSEREDTDRRTTRHEAQNQLLHQYSSHVFWPIGTRVVTVYGTGYVMNHNRVTGIHEVNLSYGRGYFSVATIVGAESLSNNALEVTVLASSSPLCPSVCLSVCLPSVLC